MCAPWNLSRSEETSHAVVVGRTVEWLPAPAPSERVKLNRKATVEKAQEFEKEGQGRETGGRRDARVSEVYASCESSFCFGSGDSPDIKRICGDNERERTAFAAFQS